ncbi:hypothetical protein HYV49_03435 [Candidatus Pacearchaeota archaeon]|nr:hypothetical protein [Candidatus Pacearchaeota archaeon]
MTVYEEQSFIDYAIRSCLPYVDDLVIVEGSYQEVLALGATPRSHDGTIQIIENYRSNPKVDILYVNAQTDKDQRNLGLQRIKELNPDDWCIIVDSDEIYDKNTFSIIKNLCQKMEKQNQYAAYFSSLTFVNDMKHYTMQEFPRLFKITKDCQFVNDNYMIWPDKDIMQWASPWVIKQPNIKYWHYAFCKGTEKFLQKKNWWNSRFKETNPNFEYDWYVDKDGKFYSPNHKIFLYDGKHPDIMQKHPLYKQTYGGNANGDEK